MYILSEKYLITHNCGSPRVQCVFTTICINAIISRVYKDIVNLHADIAFWIMKWLFFIPRYYIWIKLSFDRAIGSLFEESSRWFIPQKTSTVEFICHECKHTYIILCKVRFVIRRNNSTSKIKTVNSRTHKQEHWWIICDDFLTHANYNTTTQKIWCPWCDNYDNKYHTDFRIIIATSSSHSNTIITSVGEAI